MSSFIPCYDFRLPVIDDHSRKPYLKSQSEAHEKDTIQSASPSGQRTRSESCEEAFERGLFADNFNRMQDEIGFERT